MILVSACLGGESVRYNGTHCLNHRLRKLVEEGKAMLACPELMGGLPTPRDPAEIQGGTAQDVLEGKAKVVSISGNDVTDCYLKGAYGMLEIAQRVRATCVVLKESSPSCGSTTIYSGDFDNTKKSGMGVTAALLTMHGFSVVSENEIEGLC